jgi:hypothetical protein
MFPVFFIQSMSVSPAILLLPYLAGVLVVSLLAAFALYRLLRFGTPSGGSWLMVLFFCIGVAIVAGFTVWQLAGTDWQRVGTFNLGSPALTPKL